MRFAPLAVLALSTTASLAQARDGAVALDWDEPVVGQAEVVVTLRGDSGQPNLTLREDVAVGARGIRVALPPLPRATHSVQAGLVRDGHVTDQGAIVTVEGRIGLDYDMTLHQDLAVAFADHWDCDRGQRLTITQTADALEVAQNGTVTQFLPQDGDYASAEGSTLVFDGNRAIFDPESTSPKTCAPALFPPIFPLTAVARDAGWRFDLDRGTAVIELPGLEREALEATGLIITAPRDGVITLRNDQLALSLTETRCQIAKTGLAYPMRATLTAQGLDVTPEGCAGDPLALLRGVEWRVQSLLGIPLSPSSASELTIKVVDGQISGRGACNRYVGIAGIGPTGLAFRDFGTTRLACATDLRNIELRFLDALEAATGFDVSPAGQLTLTAGPMPVLTALRRDAP